MSSTVISIRTDRELKTQAQTLFDTLGVNMTTAINMFLRQAVYKRNVWTADDFDSKAEAVGVESIRELTKHDSW